MIIRRNWHSYVCYNETIVHRQGKNPPPSPNPPTILSLFLKDFVLLITDHLVKSGLFQRWIRSSLAFDKNG